MIVYHTSTIEIVKPDVVHSRPRLDFGKGFYLTFLRTQSEQYGERYKIQGENAIMNIYELDEQRPNCTYRFFEGYDSDWLDFVTACRMGLDHEIYDVIEGGIADDKVFNTIDLYFSGIYTRQQALDQLLYKKPNHQICITSQDVINKHLHFVESVKL